MSHLGLYKTKIVNANPEIARKALEILAGEIHAKEIMGEYRNKWGVNVRANIGVISSIADGFGVNITESGELQILGDNYSNKTSFDNARTRFLQLYYAIALNTALQNLGYHTGADISSQDTILVTAEVD